MWGIKNDFTEILGLDLKEDEHLTQELLLNKFNISPDKSLLVA
jgi:hypothetical protein